MSQPKTVILILLVIILAGSFFISCKEYDRNNSFSHVSNSSISKGEELAKKYCQSCHSLPDPSWLDAKTWDEGVLPVMGPLLGISRHNYKRYFSAKGDPYLDSSYYPSKPVMEPEEWQHIIDYYTATSPDSLPGHDRKEPIQQGLSVFKVERSALSYENPAVSFIEINPADSLHPLLISDVISKNIYSFDRELRVSDSINTDWAAVDVIFDQDKIIVCDIGMLNPNNGKFGRAGLINIEKGKIKADTAVLFKDLQRPVHLTAADLNNDHKTDYVVCEFGNHTGKLSWMENTGGNQFSKHILKSNPGAITSYVNDYNHDGAQDIWVLFGQAEEGIFLYTNKGKGRFEEKQVLRFPSVYGSSSFELVDFNKDGFDDIVYTCGDNADYSIILKPYHGVYVFLNDGKSNFTQKYFYPINGCYKAIAKDFDNDGDLDIATIAFFADYEKQPEEGFVYLEQKKDFTFTPYTLPECKAGRWLTMNAGDIDGDGMIDLVLGNFSIRPSAMPSSADWTKGPVFLLLKNQTGKLQTQK